MDAILVFLAPIMETLAGKYGVIVTVVAWIGTLHLLVKPLLAIAKVIAGATETTKDDEIIVKIESSPYYTYALNVMEWLTSLDLSKKEVVKIEAKKEEIKE